MARATDDTQAYLPHTAMPVAGARCYAVYMAFFFTVLYLPIADILFAVLLLLRLLPTTYGTAFLLRILLGWFWLLYFDVPTTMWTARHGVPHPTHHTLSTCLQFTFAGPRARICGDANSVGRVDYPHRVPLPLGRMAYFRVRRL